MHQFIYPALVCAATLFSAAAFASATEETTVQPLDTVTLQNHTTDWKQANQKVAELGGWQYYASEAGGHQGMDHSKHSMPMDHSKHSEAMDHSTHSEPMDHSKHSMPMDHSKHSEAMDHSKDSKPMDHSKHSEPMDHSKHNKVKTGDEDEHHH